MSASVTMLPTAAKSPPVQPRACIRIAVREGLPWITMSRRQRKGFDQCRVEQPPEERPPSGEEIRALLVASLVVTLSPKRLARLRHFLETSAASARDDRAAAVAKAALAIVG